MKITEKTKKYFDLVNAIETMSDSINKHKAELKEVADEIKEYLESQGLKSIKDDSGRSIFMRDPFVSASIKPEKKEEAIKIMKEEWGLSELFKESIHAKTLSRIIKERLENGDSVPDDLFEVYMGQIVSHRR